MNLGLALPGVSALKFAAGFEVNRCVGASDCQVSVNVTISASLFASVVCSSAFVVGMTFTAPGTDFVVPKSRGLSFGNLLFVFGDDCRHVCEHLLWVSSEERVVEKD